MSESTHIKLPFEASYAFLIGINDYKHVSKLTTAVNDAMALAEKLELDHNYQVHPPLLNPSKEEMLQLFQEMVALIKPADRVFFYFAGHGIALDSDDNPNGYLIPADALPDDPSSLIPMDHLHEVITSLPCKHGLLIMDCCFSGAFKWSTGFRDGIFDLPAVVYEERFYQYTRDPAWQVITSSASDQKAVDILFDRTLGFRNDKEAMHSPFAQALLDGIDGAGDTVPKNQGDGVITATELYTYLRDRVEDETTSQGKRQSPSMFSLNRHDKGQYIFLDPNNRYNLPPVPRRNPFMGLKSYNESDVQVFYGRDRVIEALVQLAQDVPLIVVSGASGTGKSSVIKAGLLPNLREQGWEILPVIRPGKEPLQNLGQYEADISAALQKDIPSLLVIDQYEELITQCLRPEDREAFEQKLANWIQANQQFKVIISIRSDFEPQFEGKGLKEWWQNGRYVVPAFSQDEIREVIIKPAIQEILFFEPDTLVDTLVDAVNQAPGALPLLSFTLSELYHAYIDSGRTNRALIVEDYEKLGGVIGALRTRANTLYDTFENEQQDSMRKLMIRMVSLEGGELASRRVLEDDLIFSNPNETEKIHLVADKLVDSRLISTGIDKSGKKYYEPAHDALVRAWTRLWEWIKAMGEAKLSLLYKLSLAVVDYEAVKHGAKSKDYLWNDDPRLDLLHSDLQGSSHFLNAQEEAFLRESMELRKRNSRQRRTLVTVTIAILLGISAFAVWEALEANRQAKRAEDNLRMAQVSDSLAQIRAEEAIRSDSIAQVQRDSAIAARQVAITERNRADNEAREANASALVAKARQIEPSNATVAANLAFAAYKLANIQETRAALREIVGNSSNSFFTYSALHNGPVRAVAFSPDGTQFLSGSKDKRAMLWNAQTGSLVQIFEGHTYGVVDVAFSPRGEKIATAGSYDKTAKLWDKNTGKELLTLSGHAAIVSAVAFSPDGNKILTGSEDKTAKLWDIQSGRLIQTFAGHTYGVTDVAFSPNGTKLITASYDNTAIIWNTNSGEKELTLSGHQFAITAVAFSPDGTKVLTGSYDNTAKLWNSNNGNLIQSFTHHKENINAVAFSPDGTSILTGSEDNSAVLLNTMNGKIIKHFLGHSSDIYAVAFSPDGEKIITGSEDNAVKFWFIQTGTAVQTLRGHTDRHQSVAFSPNGKNILTGSWDKEAILWEVENGLRLRTFSGHDAWIHSVAFSPDGKYILTGAGGISEPKDWTARLWETQTGNEIVNFSGHLDPIVSVDISSDGKWVLTGSEDNTAKLWESKSGTLIQTFSGHSFYVRAVAFSPNDDLILTGSGDRTAKLWDRNSGELIRTFSGHTSMINDVDFSPDGEFILTCSGDASNSKDFTARLWRVQTGSLERTFNGHTGSVNSAVFSRDGNTILTGSDDYTAIIWNTRDGSVVLTLNGHTDKVYSVAFSPDQQQVLTGSEDYTSKVWTLPNFYTWDHRIYKFNPAERAQYQINVNY